MNSSPVLPDDLDPLERSLLEGITRLEGTIEPWPPGPLDPDLAAELFEAQVTSRNLDHTARWLRAQGHGYYTIGSAGHESNAAVALALRPTDPALLHYRSGGFYVARSSQVPGSDPVADILLGMLAAASEPIAGGRHKVFGNKRLSIIPQTSTVASHAPRAVGLARALDLARESGVGGEWPADSVVVCSFGDASLNHSTIQGALNWAGLEAHRGMRVPVLFVCEDNGLGISVPSPDGWVADSTGAATTLLPGRADGRDPAGIMATTRDLSAEVRSSGRPAFLHLRTVRFLGHAGTDVESAYRSADRIRSESERDPILATARLLVRCDATRSADLVAWYLDQRSEIRQRALALTKEPELRSADEIMAPLAPRHPTVTVDEAERLHGDGIPEMLTLAQTINRALGDVLAAKREALVFGEDVGRKGGVYGVTRGLQKRFGPERVFDTHLDEQSILGLALGAGLNGFIPIPEIQYLAYLHNAEDQLRGEAASLQFFSLGQYRNPMVVRIAGYAYQRGFGGHFHNDNSVAVLRDVPGLVVASPAHPADAAPMLKTCVASASVDGSVCVFLEPIARYHTTDLHEEGDAGWLAPFEPSPADHVPIGSGRTHGHGSDLTIVTWANGLFLSLRAQRRLADEHDVTARILDLRWLAPLPREQLLAEARATGRVLVVDETRRSGGVGEGVLAELVEGGFRGVMRRISARDSLVPLGAAAELVLVSEDQIVAAALTLP
jgi:2-oxoisovalerate dehydrogenase E1 component